MSKMCSNPAETHTFGEGVCIVCGLKEVDYLYAELSESKEEPKVTYISIAPTWSSMMPYLIHLIRNGTKENQDFAEGELMKLAHNYDEASRIYREQQEK